MIKKFFALLISCILLSGCGNADLLSNILTEAEIIEEGKLYFDCSEEINKTKGDTVNSIGYLCSVIINEQTVLTDNNNQTLTLNEIKAGDLINIYFVTPQNINDNNKSFEAKKIVIVESNN